MTGPQMSVVRALDDNVDASIEECSDQIKDLTTKLAELYTRRAELEALRDMREQFNGALTNG